MTDEPVLKSRPEDFLVRESLVVALSDSAQAPHHYVTLRKCGFTTIEAVRLIAEQLAVPTLDITYAGMKDEDGITEQLLALPRSALTDQTLSQGWWVHRQPERWMVVRHHGFGSVPLSIGELEGNGFLVTVRNLEPALASALREKQKVNLFFLNYYDTQRFGVPGGPKRTHLLGQAIMAEEWDVARAELVALNAPESELGRSWSGSAKSLFSEGLDPRVTSFYLASYSSHRWNQDLAAEFGRGAAARQVDIEGLRYQYATSPDGVAQLLARCQDLPYRRLTFDRGVIASRESLRPTVVQTVMRIGENLADDLNRGKNEVQLRFLLPSGCYATAAVRQLLGFFRT